MFQTIFKRYENKYIINETQFRKLSAAIEKYTVPDRYAKSDVCSIYYDTPDNRIIRASIEKPPYKEKLRLRSYGVPSESTHCFLELKKKYKGVVYKRRVAVPYSDGISYMEGGGTLPPSQIKNEIEWFKNYYGVLLPSVDIFYKRAAFCDACDPNVRLTFDTDIMFRDYELDLKTEFTAKEFCKTDFTLWSLKPRAQCRCGRQGCSQSLKYIRPLFQNTERLTK